MLHAICTYILILTSLITGHRGSMSVPKDIRYTPFFTDICSSIKCWNAYTIHTLVLNIYKSDIDMVVVYLIKLWKLKHFLINMFFSVIKILVKLHNCITYLCTRTYICSKLSKKICIHNDLTKSIKKQKRGNNSLTA